MSKNKQNAGRKKGEKLSTEKILELLAKYPEFKQCEMAKATGLSYKSVVNARKKLEAQKKIICIRTEPSSNKGGNRKIWSLTDKGFFDSIETLPFEILIQKISIRKELHLLFRRIEELQLEKTPNLAREIIRRNKYRLYDYHFHEETIEHEITDLLLGLTLWNMLCNEDDNAYADDIINRTPDDSQLRVEAKVFLANNPWMKKRLLSWIDEHTQDLQNKLDFFNRLHSEAEKMQLIKLD